MYYYDPLNLHPPRAIDLIHNTIRQLFSRLPITCPINPSTTTNVTIKDPHPDWWLDVWYAHAPHQPSNNLPRHHPQPMTHTNSGGNSIPNASQIRPHGGTRPPNSKLRPRALHNQPRPRMTSPATPEPSQDENYKEEKRHQPNTPHTPRTNQTPIFTYTLYKQDTAPDRTHTQTIQKDANSNTHTPHQLTPQDRRRPKITPANP